MTFSDSLSVAFVLSAAASSSSISPSRAPVAGC